MAAILKSIKGPFAKRFMTILMKRDSRWLSRLSVATRAGRSYRVSQRGAVDWRWSSAGARAGCLDVPLGVDPILDDLPGDFEGHEG